MESAVPDISVHMALRGDSLHQVGTDLRDEYQVHMALRGDSLELPPQDLLEDILNRLGGDARDIAIARCVCKDWRNAGNHSRSLRITVLNQYHERARILDVRSSRCQIPGTPRVDGRSHLTFKDQMVQILKQKESLVQLCIEVESRLQAKIVPEVENRRTDFWMSDPCFLTKWLPAMKLTLEDLCIVDYGQQALTHSSTIMKILSESCKGLKTLELRNMYVDTFECEKMPSMVSLTWRCVKVTRGALEDINVMMPKLQTLALCGVFGVKWGKLTFPELKVLSLGLFTPASDLEMSLPRLEELHFKMQCPDWKLHIRAPVLKYVAFNLEVIEPSSTVGLRCIDGSQELQYGPSSFITLSSFAEKSPYLEKFFLDIPWACVHHALDIPCMALLKDGRYSNVMSCTNPSRLHECGHLEKTPGLRQWKQHIPDGLNLRMKVSGA